MWSSPQRNKMEKTATNGDQMATIAEIDEVFLCWQMQFGKERAKLDKVREKAIRGRLLDGYSVQDLKDAIRGCSLSRFHRGENDRQKKYQDISLICRDAYHVDEFIDVFEAEKRKQAKLEHYRNESPMTRTNHDGMQQLRAIVGGRK